MITAEKKETSVSGKKELFPEVLEEEKKPHLDVDLDTLYARTFSELGLQQSKRDQIITLYLAMFSFLIPFALSMESIGWQAKGLILLVAAIVGILFALIIVRYRIYKEVYWLSCQSLTVLHGIKPEKMNKEMIQKIYYRTLKKKGKAFLKINRNGEQHFSYKNNENSWNNKKNFEETKKRDDFKNQWCKENNIPLIRIPYTHLNNLCLNDLILETSKFIIL